MGYIDKMKYITQKLPNIIDNELLDRFVRGITSKHIQKRSLKRTQILLKRHIILLKDAHAWMHLTQICSNLNRCMLGCLQAKIA